MSEKAEKRNEELLRSGRRVLLLTAGYTENELAGLGDLAEVKAERMREILHRKTVEADVEKANPPIKAPMKGKKGHGGPHQAASADE